MYAVLVIERLFVTPSHMLYQNNPSLALFLICESYILNSYSITLIFLILFKLFFHFVSLAVLDLLENKF